MTAPTLAGWKELMQKLHFERWELLKRIDKDRVRLRDVDSEILKIVEMTDGE